MKKTNNTFKTILLITAIVFSISSFAQAPSKMSYQAVIRDATNNLIVNQSVGLQISILQTSATGTAVFVETHSITTNANGLVSVEIGNGTNVSGSISGINWGTDAYFIKTETDPTGGTSYSISATNQLLSVPYALSSEKASDMDLLDLTDVTGIPTSGQVLKWDGTAWKPQNDLTTGGGTGSYSAGAGITISGTNVIAADLGADISTAELQNNAVTTAKIASNAVTSSELSNNAVTTAKITANAVTSNEIATGAVTAPKIDQMGATSGQVMQYNGTAWAPATPTGGTTYTAGSGVAISGTNAISATLGTDIATGEIQNNAVTTAKIATNAVTSTEIANNAVNTAQLANDAVTAPKIDQMGATSGQVIKWSGSAWAPAADNTGSASYTAGSGINISGSNAISSTLGTDIATAEIQNDAVTNAKIANNAVNTAQLANDAVTAPKIDDMGASNGQVLQYNGTNWAPTTPTATTSPWTLAGSNVYRNTGNVGIGTTTPTSKLQVDGGVRINANANALTLDGSSPYIRILNGGVYKGFLWSNSKGIELGTSSGSTEDLILSTGLNDRMTIKSTGNIGIGTSTPTHKLEISSGSAGTDVLAVINTSSSDSSAAIKGELVGNTPTGGAIALQGADNYANISDLDISGDEIGILGYSNGGFAGDNYGVYGHSNGVGVKAISSNATKAALEVENTSSGPAIVTNGGDVEINGKTLINRSGEALRIDGTNPYITLFNGGLPKGYLWSNTSNFEISTASGSTEDLILSTGFVDRITIKPSGNIGIGVATPARKLDVAGDIKATGRLYLGSINYFGYVSNYLTELNGALIPVFDDFDDLGSATKRWDDIYATNGTVQTSDRRDKTNIQNLDYGLKEIMELRAVRFQWKDRTDEKFKLGFIAQELQPILNEVVKEDDKVRNEDGTTTKVQNDRLGVYYSDIIPVAVKAIQEQQAIINSQQSQIDNQQKQIDELKALIMKK